MPGKKKGLAGAAANKALKRPLADGRRRGMNKRVLTGVMTALAVLVAAVIFYLSSQPAESSAKTSGGVTEWMLRLFSPGYADLSSREQMELLKKYEEPVRKAAHGLEFAALGACLFLALHGFRVRRAPVWALLGGALYACMDEAHQMLVDGRGPALSDVGIDTGGVLFGVLAGLMLLAVFHHFWPARGDA